MRLFNSFIREVVDFGASTFSTSFFSAKTLAGFSAFLVVFFTSFDFWLSSLVFKKSNMAMFYLFL
jgi:diacylglycerol kinase